MMRRTIALSCAALALVMKGTCAFQAISVVRLAVPVNNNRAALFVSMSSNNDDTKDNGGMDPATVTKSVVSTEKKSSSSSSEVDLKTLAVQGGVVVVSLILVLTGLSSLFNAMTGVATSAAGALGDEVAREAGNVLGLLVTILSALASAAWSGLTVVIPALFKGLYSLGVAAAPVVRAVGETVGDVAAPLVEETTARIGEAASPYVDQMQATLDAQIVQPTLQVIDANVMTPLQDVGNSVTNAVDTTLHQATDTVTNSINEKINQLNDAMLIK